MQRAFHGGFPKKARPSKWRILAVDLSRRGRTHRLQMPLIQDLPASGVHFRPPRFSLRPSRPHMLAMLTLVDAPAPVHSSCLRALDHVARLAQCESASPSAKVASRFGPFRASSGTDLVSPARLAKKGYCLVDRGADIRDKPALRAALGLKGAVAAAGKDARSTRRVVCAPRTQ